MKQRLYDDFPKMSDDSSDSSEDEEDGDDKSGMFSWCQVRRMGRTNAGCSLGARLEGWG